MNVVLAADEAVPLCIYIKSEPCDEDQPAGGETRSGPEEGSPEGRSLEGESQPLPKPWENKVEESQDIRGIETTCKLENNYKAEADTEFSIQLGDNNDIRENIASTRRKKKKKSINKTVKKKKRKCLSTDDKRVECPICFKSISSAYKLREHMTVHTGAKPYACHCGQSFRLKSVLRDHQETHHTDGERKRKPDKEEGYVCSECGKMFKKLYLLKQHFRAHSDDRPFVCDTCEKAFKSKGHLIDHMDSHTTGQPFMCSKCGNCFKRASCLKCHIRDGHCIAGDRTKRKKPQGLHRRKKKQKKPKDPVEKPVIVKQFPCDLCSTSYSNIKNLYTHKRYVHRGLKMHKCRFCEKDFRDNFLKVQHERVHTGERPFACDACGNSFNTRSYLKSHSKLCRGRRIIPRPESPKAPSTEREQVKVENTKLEPEEQASSLCETQLEVVSGTKSDGEMELCEAARTDSACGGSRVDVGHGSDSDPGSPRDVGSPSDVKLECPDEAETKCNVLIKHIDINKPFACEQCDKTFKLTAQLNNHILTHSEKTFSCDECGKTFSRLTYLNTHIKTHSNIKNHKCEHCGKPFATTAELRSHTRTHTGERPYLCKTCGQTFGYRASLNNHKKTHGGKETEKFKCSECDKAYSHKKTLEMHKMKHAGLRPYRCKECGKSFVWENNLKSHARSHAAEKPYVCGECGKGFARKDTLRFHSATHGGERPFVCHRCGKGFFRSSSLATHVKTHAEVRPYGCERCGKRFALPNGLKKHTESHQKIRRKARADDAMSFIGF